MISRERNSIYRYPIYRLCGEPGRYELIKLPGVGHAVYNPSKDPAEVSASTVSKESVFAVMRLFDVDEYEDWTKE